MRFMPPSFPRPQTGLLGTIVGAARSAASLPQDIAGTLAARVRAAPDHIKHSIENSRAALRQYREGAPAEAPARARREVQPPPAAQAEPIDLAPSPGAIDSGSPWLTQAMALRPGARQETPAATAPSSSLAYAYAPRTARRMGRPPIMRS